MQSTGPQLFSMNHLLIRGCAINSRLCDLVPFQTDEFGPPRSRLPKQTVFHQLIIDRVWNDALDIFAKDGWENKTHCLNSLRTKNRNHIWRQHWSRKSCGSGAVFWSLLWLSGRSQQTFLIQCIESCHCTKIWDTLKRCMCPICLTISSKEEQIPPGKRKVQ